MECREGGRGVYYLDLDYYSVCVCSHTPHAPLVCVCACARPFLSQYDNEATSIAEYGELAIDFGYTALFSAALPITAMLAFLSGCAELKSRRCVCRSCFCLSGRH